jgi:hypothetical protein
MNVPVRKSLKIEDEMRFRAILNLESITNCQQTKSVLKPLTWQG